MGVVIRRLLRTLRQLPGRRAKGGELPRRQRRPDEHLAILSSGWYKLPPGTSKLDYTRIDQLERELGLVDERPVRAARVCLVKDCDGGDEVRAWSGLLLTRVHNHPNHRKEKP